MKSLKHEVRDKMAKPVADSTRKRINTIIYTEISDMKWENQVAISRAYWITKTEIEGYVNEKR